MLTRLPARGDSTHFHRMTGSSCWPRLEGVDVLMSHMAPWDIFDQTLGGHWGSSNSLLQQIKWAKPKVGGGGWGRGWCSAVGRPEKLARV